MCFLPVLYFDTTLDKKGIGTLLVDEDDIKRASESQNKRVLSLFIVSSTGIGSEESLVFAGCKWLYTRDERCWYMQLTIYTGIIHMSAER